MGSNGVGFARLACGAGYPAWSWAAVVVPAAAAGAGDACMALRDKALSKMHKEIFWVLVSAL